MSKRYFKVKYGFSIADQVSIEEKDLQKAIYAQVAGVPVQLKNAYINGRNIISITPHWHKHTGWNEFYEPKDGEDFNQIKRDCPNYDCVIEAHKNKVFELMRSGQVKLLESGGVPIEESEILKLRDGSESNTRLLDGVGKDKALSEVSKRLRIK